MTSHTSSQVDGTDGPSLGAPDNAYDVLVSVRERVAPECPEELLRLCFEIQRRYQFDRDEQMPLVTTRRLVEGYVEKELEATTQRTKTKNA